MELKTKRIIAREVLLAAIAVCMLVILQVAQMMSAPFGVIDMLQFLISWFALIVYPIRVFILAVRWAWTNYFRK